MLKRILAVLAGLAMLVVKPAETETGFYHTSGGSIIDPAGEPAVLCGMGFGNDVWYGSLEEVGLHHNEDSFKEMSELGFNTVRFLLNYRWFEDDSAPYVYKQEGFDFLDQSIEWAKKYKIGLVLNMHYPQGGYQSQGKGTALWTDPENQSRLSALWGEIARRYADEPAVIGYGIVNEPVVPERSTVEQTIGQCRELVQRCTDEIRKSDRNHIIFAERVAAVQDIYTGKTLWGEYPPDSLWYLIDDPNTVYEAHFYEPFEFTHQTADKASEYPSPEPYADDYVSYWAGCLSANQTEIERYYETDYFQRSDEYNLFSPVLHTWKLGAGSAGFDDITVKEYSPDGRARIIWHEDFADGTDPSAQLRNIWSSDGSGSFDIGGGHCAIRAADEDYVLTFRQFELKEGFRYKVGGHISAESLPEGSAVNIRADFALAGRIFGGGKDYISAKLSEIAGFGEKNGVPVFLGEFGADAESFKEDRGGGRWVEDVLDYCVENRLSFSYHAYHEPMFGFYPENTNKYPQVRNEVLARLFAEKLRD